MVTIDDVASRAGVSKSTVSRVINATAPVNEETKTRILSAMDELQFKPSLIAQGMRFKRTKTVGMVIPDYANPFYSYMFKEIEAALRKYDYMAIICPTSGVFEEEAEYIDRLLHRRIDGIIFFTYNNGKEHAGFLHKMAQQLPFVLMDESKDELPVSQVVTNGYKGMKEAVQYLINKGHRRIGCLSSYKESGQRRVQGYLDTLQENGIEVDPNIICPCGYRLQDGIEAAQHYAALEDRPTAVVAVADFMAIGLIKHLHTLGINVPNDIEVIGFDNIDLAFIMEPTLTTVAQQIDVLADEAVNLIMDKINNPERKTEIKKVIIDGRLIFRQTTKPKSSK